MNTFRFRVSQLVEQRRRTLSQKQLQKELDQLAVKIKWHSLISSSLCAICGLVIGYMMKGYLG